MDFPGIHSLLLSIVNFQSRDSVTAPTVLPLLRTFPPSAAP